MVRSGQLYYDFGWEGGSKDRITHRMNLREHVDERFSNFWAIHANEILLSCVNKMD